jgi:hypothetical protein
MTAGVASGNIEAKVIPTDPAVTPAAVVIGSDIGFPSERKNPADAR